VRRHLSRQAVFHGLGCGQPEVPVHVGEHLLRLLARGLGHDLVVALAHLEDLLGRDRQVRGAPMAPGGRLVDQEPGVRQAEALLPVRGQEHEDGSRGAYTVHHRPDRGLHEAQQIIDREAGVGAAARGIDENGHRLGGVLLLHHQQLGLELGSHLHGHRARADDGPGLQELALQEVHAALLARGALLLPGTWIVQGLPHRVASLTRRPPGPFPGARRSSRAILGAGPGHSQTEPAGRGGGSMRDGRGGFF